MKEGKGKFPQAVHTPNQQDIDFYKKYFGGVPKGYPYPKPPKEKVVHTFDSGDSLPASMAPLVNTVPPGTVVPVTAKSIWGKQFNIPQGPPVVGPQEASLGEASGEQVQPHQGWQADGPPQASAQEGALGGPAFAGGSEGLGQAQAATQQALLTPEEDNLLDKLANDHHVQQVSIKQAFQEAYNAQVEALCTQKMSLGIPCHTVMGSGGTKYLLTGLKPQFKAAANAPKGIINPPGGWPSPKVSLDELDAANQAPWSAGGTVPKSKVTYPPMHVVSLPLGHWAQMSPKAKWDSLVGLRGPDCPEAQDWIKFFTSSLVRGRLRDVLESMGTRAGGMVNTEFYLMILPKENPGKWGSDHFFQHAYEAAMHLNIPYMHLQGHSSFIKACQVAGTYKHVIGDLVAGTYGAVSQAYVEQITRWCQERGISIPSSPKKEGATA